MHTQIPLFTGRFNATIPEGPLHYHDGYKKNHVVVHKLHLAAADRQRRVSHNALQPCSVHQARQLGVRLDLLSQFDLALI